jgi:hypothetical protein
MVLCVFLQFAEIDVHRKLPEMEHRIVLTVLAKKGYILAKIHILQVVGDEAPIATLHPLAELLQYLFIHNCV